MPCRPRGLGWDQPYGSAHRYYVLEGTVLRVFDAGWKAIEAFDLLETAMGPFKAFDLISSGPLQVKSPC